MIGHGGVSAVAEATGLARRTIYRGLEPPVSDDAKGFDTQADATKGNPCSVCIRRSDDCRNRASRWDRRGAQDADSHSRRDRHRQGKEQMARHAHAASRRTGSFVAVNCAALPDSLIEAELFGYKEGRLGGTVQGG
jgi:transcriptional regulator of acetoin/glycerol metabolism